MKVHIKSYAKNEDKTIQLHDYTREYDRLDELTALLDNLYKQLYYRSGNEYNEGAQDEAKRHAYALWIACDKFQVINRAGNTRYVVDVEIISGEHDAT